MINYIWLFLILSGILISIVTGNIKNIGSIILNSTNDAFSIFMKMSLMILFWNGMFNILKDSGYLKKLSRLLSKLLKFIFPEINQDSQVMEYISITLISNIIGLGVASTSTGLQAFKLLKEEAKDTKYPTKSMITFLILNISTFTFFPTTIISMRAAYNGSVNIKLIFVIFITSLFGTIIGQILNKVLNK